MKRSIVIIVVLVFGFISLYSQNSTQPLSKTAQNGALYEAQLADDGTLSLVYGYMAKKEQKFVNYSFDKELKMEHCMKLSWPMMEPCRSFMGTWQKKSKSL